MIKRRWIIAIKNVDFLIDEINFEELYNKAVKCGCLSHGGGKVRDTNNRLASLEGHKIPSFNAS